jgi:lipoprotein NlpD
MPKTPVLIVVLAGLLLTACSNTYKAPIADRSNNTATVHRVIRGETLYSIAWTYGLDYHQLAKWNGIGRGYAIYPGQKIRLRPPTRKYTKATKNKTTSKPTSRTSTQMKSSSRPKPPAAIATWQWPTQGKVIRGFSRNESGKKGIDIAGRTGQKVVASAAGKVVYSGSGLLRYGKLIIIKHNDTYLSAYAHNRRLLVSEGQTVKQGQPIAEMGRSGTDRTMLHFEIRKNGKPINPLYFLSKR